MRRHRALRLAAAAALGLACALGAQAQIQAQNRAACEKEVGYRPTSGQKGKDAIWVPTPDEFVSRMLRMAHTTADDYVIDLGSGDGNFTIAAAKTFGARSLGIEYNPALVKLAQCLVRAEGMQARARIVEGDVFKEDFSRADVVTIFLLPHLNQCLRHRLLAMRPGVRVVSYLFSTGDWEPDDVTSMELNVAFLWVTPARVAGRWSLRTVDGPERTFTVDLAQVYQKIGGEVSAGARRSPLLGAFLRGDLLRFSFLDDQGVHLNFSGRVAGRQVSGDLRAADGESVEVMGSLEGTPLPAPWADMDPKCRKFYAP